MCDACRLLGTPWLPELHGGAPRPRTQLKAMKLRQAAAKPAPTSKPPRPDSRVKRGR